MDCTGELFLSWLFFFCLALLSLLVVAVTVCACDSQISKPDTKSVMDLLVG